MPPPTVTDGYIERILRPTKRDAYDYFRGSAMIKLTGGPAILHNDDWKLLDEFVHMTVESEAVDPTFPRGQHIVKHVRYEPRKPDTHTARKLLQLISTKPVTAAVLDKISVICNDGNKTLADLETLFRMEEGNMDAMDKRTTLFFYHQMQGVIQVYGEEAVVMGKLTRADVVHIKGIIDTGRVDLLLWPDHINGTCGLHIPKLPWEKLREFYDANPNPNVPLARLKVAYELYYDIIADYAEKTSQSCVFLKNIRERWALECLHNVPKRTKLNSGGWTKRLQEMPPAFEDALDLLCQSPYCAIHTGSVGDPSNDRCRGRFFIGAKNYAICNAVANKIKAVQASKVVDRSGMDEMGFIHYAQRAIEIDAHGNPTGIRISEVQINSMHALYRYPVLAINGKPGCGKTSVFIKSCFLLKEYADEVRRDTSLSPTTTAKIKVLAVAPTGMAAYNVHRATGGDCCTIDLHYMKKQFGKREEVDLVIVEEASACDEKRLYRLFKSVKRVRQIVFVFDNDQLPPVGSGFPSYTIFHYLKNIQPRVCAEDGTQRLLHVYKTNYRFAASEKNVMLQNCEAILTQKEALLDYSLDEEGTHPLVLVYTKGGSVCRTAQLWEKMMRKTPKREAQILAFQNSTVEAVNKKCYDSYYKPQSTTVAAATAEGGVKKENRRVKSVVHFIVGMRMLFTKNFYAERDRVAMEKEMLATENARRFLLGLPRIAALPADVTKECMSHNVMNGEIWNIGRIDKVERSGIRRCVQTNLKETELTCSQAYDYKIYNEDGSHWVFLGDFMPKEIRYASCITGHKSQGSQYPYIIICLEDGVSDNMSINLLYTEVSRAQKQVYIVTNVASGGGTHGQLSKAILKSSVVRRDGALGIFLGVYGEISWRGRDTCL